MIFEVQWNILKTIFESKLWRVEKLWEEEEKKRNWKESFKKATLSKKISNSKEIKGGKGPHQTVKKAEICQWQEFCCLH